MQRITQFNSVGYEEEFKYMLREVLYDSFKLLPYVNNNLKDHIESELHFLPELFYYFLGINQGRNLPGHSFENARLSSSGSEYKPLNEFNKKTYFFLKIMLPYFIRRSKAFLIKGTKGEEKQSIEIAFGRVEKLKKTLDLINFLAFLYGKKYPNMEMRMAQIRHVPIDPSQLRWLDYEYLNREIIWTELSSFVFAAMPFIKDMAMTNLFQKIYLFTTLLGPFQISLDEETNTQKCVVCGAEPPTMPRQIQPCMHLFCYYCYESKFQGEEEQDKSCRMCPKCNIRVQTVKTRGIV